MRIGFVAPEFPPELGGMQTYAAELASAVARAGHAVTVFAPPGAALDQRGIEVVPKLRLRRRYDEPLFNSHPVDVWHVLNAGYAWLANRTPPVFVSAHGDDFLNQWVRAEQLDLPTRLGLPFGSRADRWLGRWRSARAVRRGVGRVRHTFLNSCYTERAFLERYPECRGRTSVPYVGVAAAFLAAGAELGLSRAPGGLHRLVTICRLEAGRKNVDTVLRALARLADRFAFRYTIIGDGTDRPRLEALTRDLGLNDRVEFAGRQSAADLRARVRGCDLFVLTSGLSQTSFEGFGIVYLEANALGVPTLAARVGGAAEAVADGESGFFVDEPTVDGVVAALGSFFSGERRFDPEACRRFARRFDWDRVAAHVLGHYAAADGSGS